MGSRAVLVPEDPAGCPNDHAPGEPIACWNPGGPCIEKVCELCGPCLHCTPEDPAGIEANQGDE